MCVSIWKFFVKGASKEVLWPRDAKKTFLRVLETFRPTAIHTLVWWRLWKLMMNLVNSIDFYCVINSLKGFFYTFNNNLVGSQQKEGTFLIQKSWWTWIRLKLLWLKYFIPIWYSNTKILSRLIKLVFGRKSWLKNWKWPIFDCPQLTFIAKNQKILWAHSFGCKSLLDVNWHSMKFLIRLTHTMLLFPKKVIS